MSAAFDPWAALAKIREGGLAGLGGLGGGHPAKSIFAPAPAPPPVQPAPWPEGVDYHLTRTAARLSGEVAAGAGWAWCSSGGLDVEQTSGKMWLISPATVARLREARLLPDALLGCDAREPLA